MTDRVLIDLTISAPVDKVWAALRDPEQIRRWFGWETDSLAGEVDFIFVDHADVDEDARIISFQGTQDRFEVVADGANTRLRVVRSPPADDAEWSDVYEDMTEGWIMFVQQLKFGLERHRLAPRRTLWQSLSKGERDGMRPLSALGLSDLIGATPGAPVNRALPTGDEVSGRVWHASKHQVSITADAWDGLLNVHDAGSWTGGGGHGPGAVMITTYGLEDAAFSDLERRWKAWWAERYSA
jgi:hypothetical protein